MKSCDTCNHKKICKYYPIWNDHQTRYAPRDIFHGYLQDILLPTFEGTVDRRCPGIPSEDE